MNEQTVMKQCMHCGYISEITVDIEKYNRWKAGELIQKVWPESTPGWREMLKTGIHSECWDEMFKDADD